MWLPPEPDRHPPLWPYRDAHDDHWFFYAWPIDGRVWNVYDSDWMTTWNPDTAGHA